MKNKKCKHEVVSISVVATQNAYRMKDGSWEYEGAENMEDDIRAIEDGTYAFCCQCDRNLTRKECEELNLIQKVENEE
jgi:RNA polymerase-binding transcription factor DksA